MLQPDDEIYIPRVDGVWVSRTEFVITCPDCGKRKLSWNPYKDRGQCFVCKTGFNGTSLRRKLKSYRSLAARFGFGLLGKKKQLPDSSGLHRDEQLEGGCIPEFAIDTICRSRRLSRETLRAAHPVLRSQSLSVGFPITCGGYAWRSIFTDKKGWTLPGADRARAWFEVPSIDNPAICILVEGIFDCLKIHESGVPLDQYRPISCLGTSIPKTLPQALYERGVKKIVLWMDPDEAGDIGVEKAFAHFPEILFSCVFVIKHSKEPADCDNAEIREVLEGIADDFTPFSGSACKVR